MGSVLSKTSLIAQKQSQKNKQKFSITYKTNDDFDKIYQFLNSQDKSRFYIPDKIKVQIIIQFDSLTTKQKQYKIYTGYFFDSYQQKLKCPNLYIITLTSHLIKDKKKLNNIKYSFTKSFQNKQAQGVFINQNSLISLIKVKKQDAIKLNSYNYYTAKLNFLKKSQDGKLFFEKKQNISDFKQQIKQIKDIDFQKKLDQSIQYYSVITKGFLTNKQIVGFVKERTIKQVKKQDIQQLKKWIQCQSQTQCQDYIKLIKKEQQQNKINKIEKQEGENIKCPFLPFSESLNLFPLKALVIIRSQRTNLITSCGCVIFCDNKRILIVCCGHSIYNYAQLKFYEKVQIQFVNKQQINQQILIKYLNQQQKYKKKDKKQLQKQLQNKQSQIYQINQLYKQWHSKLKDKNYRLQVLNGYLSNQYVNQCEKCKKKNQQQLYKSQTYFLYDFAFLEVQPIFDQENKIQLLNDMLPKLYNLQNQNILNLIVKILNLTQNQQKINMEAIDQNQDSIQNFTQKSIVKYSESHLVKIKQMLKKENILITEEEILISDQILVYLLSTIKQCSGSPIFISGDWSKIIGIHAGSVKIKQRIYQQQQEEQKNLKKLPRDEAYFNFAVKINKNILKLKDQLIQNNLNNLVKKQCLKL